MNLYLGLAQYAKLNLIGIENINLYKHISYYGRSQHLFSYFFRIILVQNAPEKVIAPPSPNFSITIHPNRIEPSSQVVANVECNVPPPRIGNPLESSYMFDAPGCGTKTNNAKLYMETISSTSSLIKTDSTEPSYKMTSCIDKIDNVSIGKTSCDALELNIQEILALDMEYNKRHMSVAELPRTSKSDTDNNRVKNKNLFKSMPNLSASSENLLV